MLLNKTEFLFMINPVRRLIQSQYEVRQLRQISDLGINKNILEIGCGNGFGTTLIRKYFLPKKITAIDLDNKMITIARKKYANSHVKFLQADVEKLPFSNNSFHAVFDFGILHHVPNWKKALKEIHRVLKKDGQFIMEDGSIDSFSTPLGKIIKRYFDHPYKDMYSKIEFVEYLRKINFKDIKIRNVNTMGLFPFFILGARK